MGGGRGGFSPLPPHRAGLSPGAESAPGPDPGSEAPEVVFPVRVDARGAFLSYNLSHRLLSKRAVSARTRPGTFYSLFHGGQQLRFNLSLNPHLLAPGFVTEKRRGGVSRATIRASRRNPCHMIGSVQNQDKGSGPAALSTCDGLVSGLGWRRRGGQAHLVLAPARGLPLAEFLLCSTSGTAIIIL